MARHSQLYFIFGLWVSFVGFVMAGITLFPERHDVLRLTASVYGSVTDEELHRASVITQIGKAILVDEGSRKISLYENDRELRSFPILSLPVAGSVWDAPAGKYAVGKKEYKHFSPFAGVWMPYSIQISGNFFIHGDPISEEEEGVGSLHVSTPDAKEVFDFSSIGTQVVVAGTASRDSFTPLPRYHLKGNGPPEA